MYSTKGESKKKIFIRQYSVRCMCCIYSDSRIIEQNENDEKCMGRRVCECINQCIFSILTTTHIVESHTLAHRDTGTDIQAHNYTNKVIDLNT